MDASATKLPPGSRDVTAERLAQLRALCPEAFTEGKLDYPDNDQLKTNIVLEMKSHQIEFHTA